MRYFWLLDQKNNRYFKVYYQPGADKNWRLPIQSAYRSNSHACKTILHAYEQLSKNIT